MIHAFNSTVPEAERQKQGITELKGQPSLESDIEDSQDYIEKSYLEKQKGTGMSGGQM